MLKIVHIISGERATDTEWRAGLSALSESVGPLRFHDGVTVESGDPVAKWITALGISRRRNRQRRCIGGARAPACRRSARAWHGGELHDGARRLPGLDGASPGAPRGCAGCHRRGQPLRAFTLIRAYAESTAAILYVTDHPAQLNNLWRGDGHGIKIGKITNHAETRLEAFRDVYGELSSYAHPASKSLLASMRVAETSTVQWRSAPTFKSEADRIVAYAWIRELAEVSSHLLVEMGVKLELGAAADHHD